MKIADVLKQGAGIIIDHVPGTLVSVGPHENKIRPDGDPFTAQAFTLQDGADVIFGTIYDHYPLDVYLHKPIVLTSMKSKNHRFGGVTTALGVTTSIFNRKPVPNVLRVSKAGVVHSPETFKLLNRPE